MQFVVCDFAKGQTTASLSANPARSIDDMFGFNGFNTIKADMALNNLAFQNKFAELYPGHLRFPGGTVANYWDWREADFMKSDFTKHPCEWTLESYDKLVMEDHELENYKVLIDKSGAAPMYCLNATGSDRFYQLAMLYHAASINLPIEYVELGNELYKEGPCNYVFRHPNPADYAIEMLEWAGLIKGITGAAGHFPNTEIAFVGREFGANDSDRDKTWNNDVLFEIGQSVNNLAVDALTMHPYHGSRLSSNIQGTTRENCLFSSPFHSYKGFSTATFNFEIDNQIVPDGKEVWLTEHNLWDVTNIVHGSWAHALTVAYQSLIYLEKDAITKSSLHSLLGNAQWGAIFNNINGIALDGDFEPPNKCFSTMIYPIPKHLN